MNTTDEMTTAINHAKKTMRLFAGHNYDEAYRQYMTDPNGGATPARKNTTFDQFMQAFHKLRNSDGMLVFESKLATLKLSREDDRPISSVADFQGRDKDTITAIINERCQCGFNQKFHVGIEGYEFIAELNGDPDFHETQEFNVELKASPADWIETAMKLGFDIPQIRPGVWRFHKEGAEGIVDFLSPGEAAREACRYAKAVLSQDGFPSPDRLIVAYEAISPGASVVIGQSGKIYQNEGHWAGSNNCQSIDMDGFKSFWGREPEDGDDLWMMPYIDKNNMHHAIDRNDVFQYLSLGSPIPPGLTIQDYQEVILTKVSSDTALSVDDIKELLPDTQEIIQEGFSGKTKVTLIADDLAEQLNCSHAPRH